MDSLILAPSKVFGLFSLAALNIFPFSLVLCHFILKYLGMEPYLFCFRFDWFLNLQIGIFHQFYKFLSHHFFKYCLCPYSMSPQIKHTLYLPPWLNISFSIFLSLNDLFCIYFLIYISIYLPINSVHNLLLNPDTKFNLDYICFLISSSFTWLFYKSVRSSFRIFWVCHLFL